MKKTQQNAKIRRLAVEASSRLYEVDRKVRGCGWHCEGTHTCPICYRLPLKSALPMKTKKIKELKKEKR